MSEKKRPPRIVVECNLKNFIPQDLEADLVPQEKKRREKILKMVAFPFEKLGDFLVGGMFEQEEPKKKPDPNGLNGADNICRETFSTLGLKHSEYSRKNITNEENEVTGTQFRFFIPLEVKTNIETTVAKINTLLQQEATLEERWDVSVYEETQK